MTTIKTARDLLPLGELVDVRYIKLSAETLDEPREGFGDDDVEQSMQVQFGYVDRVIEVRVEATVKTRIAEYDVIAATQFHVEKDGVTVPDNVVAEFAEAVGVMAVYPYIREAVQSLTTRLHESPVTMPLMRQAKLGKTDEKATAE